MGGGIDEVFFDPKIVLIAFKESSTFGNGPSQRDKRLFRRALMLLVSGMNMSPQEQRNALTLSKPRIPRRPERFAVLPVKMMVPDPQTMRILFEVCGQPIGGLER